MERRTKPGVEREKKGRGRRQDIKGLSEKENQTGGGMRNYS